MIVGLSGYAGVGKSVAADMLSRDYGFVAVSLADPIKRAAADWFGWDEERLWGPSAARNEPDPRFRGLSARTALQKMGSDTARALYEDVWVEYALRVADSLFQSGILRSVHYSYTAAGGLRVTNVPEEPRPVGVVIPDVRYKNELAALRSRKNAMVIRIKRSMSGLTGEAAAHLSEREQQGIPDSAFDAVIDNDGSLDEFLTKVAKVVNERRNV